jgi:DNA polymerase III delta prime subunit
LIALDQKYQPTKIDDFIGLRAPKALLNKFIESPYDSAFLLIGSTGIGKTTLAFAAAHAMEAQIHHIAAKECNVERVNKLVLDCQYSPRLEDWRTGKMHAVIVDEADRMTFDAQLAFLSILDTTRRLQDTVLFFTANETKNLADRFQGRTKMIECEPPTVDEIAEFLAVVLEREGGADLKIDFMAIARKAGGSVRAALNKLETELLVPGIIQIDGATDKAPSPGRRRQGESVKKVAGARHSASRDTRLPPPGSDIVKEFRGRSIQVRILADGFRFDDKKYKSLSAIAKELAGGNRNGYSFFGLGD